MKKLFLLAILFASVTAFAGGKPATASLTKVIMQQNEFVVDAKQGSFTYCTWQSDDMPSRESAEDCISSFKRAMKEVFFFDIDWVEETGNWTCIPSCSHWNGYATYYTSGECYVDPAVKVNIEVESPKLNLKQ